MATYLEKYQTKKSAYQDLLSQGQSLSSKELCFCMEAIYRAQVLETLSLLERTCPTVQDLSAFALHARLVAGILGGLLEERRFRIYKDEKIANEQAAAYQSCFTCFNEFTSYAAPVTRHRIPTHCIRCCTPIAVRGCNTATPSLTWIINISNLKRRR